MQIRMKDLNIDKFLQSTRPIPGIENYELISVCLHHGPNINTGHYTSTLTFF